MLNQKPIFLGGQGGMVGPCRLGFGITVAAGTIVRKDETRSDRLIMGGAGKGGNVAYAPGRFRNDKRIVVNNIHYIANLIALKHWYDQVRRLFVSNRFPPAMLQALQEKVDLAIGERITRLEAVCLQEPAGGRQGQAAESSKQDRELDQLWPAIKKALQSTPDNSATAAARDQFLDAIRQGIAASGRDYIRVIQGLDPADSVKGTRWLQGIVDHVISGCRF
jgi:UDP-N-acetylglucosamine/UDP-N-acetylgalactosamine diphosphorylase